MKNIIKALLTPIIVVFAWHGMLLFCHAYGLTVTSEHFNMALLFAVLLYITMPFYVAFTANIEKLEKLESKLEAVANGKIRIKNKDLRKLYSSYQVRAFFTFSLFETSAELERKFENV